MADNPFNCGLDTALAVIGGKWKPLVLYHLSRNVHRYGELRRAIGGVSDKVLIQQLKELERDEIFARLDFQEILATALGALCAWGTEHMGTVERISERRTGALAPFDMQ
jgi:DNA-binding HxlR family transcriptional regulator